MTDEGSVRGVGETRVKWAAAAAVLLVGGILVALAVAGRGEKSEFEPGGSVPEQKVVELDAAAKAAGCEARDFQEEGDGETAGTVNYRADPPHSGQQNPQPAQDGAYYSDPPTDETLVHSLRHGRIVIWFDPDLSDDDKSDLKALYDEDTPHMFLVPARLDALRGGGHGLDPPPGLRAADPRELRRDAGLPRPLPRPRAGVRALARP